MVTRLNDSCAGVTNVSSVPDRIGDKFTVVYIFSWPPKSRFIKIERLSISIKGTVMFKEFKEFAMRGNVVDMAVGIVIGAAFGTIVKSFVADVLMPPIGLLLGNVDFSNLFAVIKEGATAAPYATLEAAQKAGAVTLNYGAFFNTVISFVIIAFAVFMVIKAINNMQKQEEETEKAPAEPPKQEQLLTEIRDILQGS